MKKIRLLFIICISLFFIGVVNAESISIKSIELIEKDDDVLILSDVSSDNLSLNINLKFFNTGDYAKYKVIIENDTDEDYLISDKEMFDETKLIKYEFIFDKNDNVFKAKSKKEFYLNVVYVKEITNDVLNDDSSFNISNKVELSLIKKDIPIIEEVKETIKEIVVDNPNTGDTILFIFISINVVIIISYILIKYKRSRYIAILLFLILPIMSKAISKLTININGNIEIIKTRMAYGCYANSYKEDTFCINWNNYVPYDTYEKDSAYLFTTNTRKLPDSYKYENVTYNLDKTYDISDLQNEQVMLGVYYDSEGIALLLIGQDNDINAPIDSSYMFGGNVRENYSIFLKVKTIDLKYYDTYDSNDLMGLVFNNVSLTNISVDNLDTGNVTNMKGLFWGCTSLISLDLRNWDTGNVTDISYMFGVKNATMNLEEIKGLEDFDTSNVTDMRTIFQNCYKLEKLQLNKWDTSKVTFMNHMFYGCKALVLLEINNWNTSNVTNMSYMFSNCNSLTSLDVSNFDTSKVTNMSYMFYYCNSLTELDVSNFDTSNVTTMKRMLMLLKNVTELDVSNWETSNVTDMNWLFAGCYKLESLDLRNWDTSSATDMEGMFNGNVSNYSGSMILREIKGVEDLDTSKATTFKAMFFGNVNLVELDLSDWDTSNVTDMSYLFTRCTALKTLKIKDWDVSKVTNFYDAIRETGLEELDLSGWHPDSMEISNRMFNANPSLHKLDVRNFNFTIVPEVWDNWAYTFSGRYDNIEIIVKDQANKDWILSHNDAGITEANITIDS